MIVPTDTPQPVGASMRRGIVIGGGWLEAGQSWSPKECDLRTIRDRVFCALRKEDRGLARFLGLDCAQRAPWKGVSLAKVLVSLRNDAVEASMMAVHQDEADPLAGEQRGPVQTLRKPKKELRENMPDVVDILIPGTSNVSPYQMSVLAPDRNGIVL